MTKVFISYSRKDKTFAGQFTEALQKSELETWIDWEDIPPTADWLDQIHKGIEQADAFLFLLSPDSVASKVCGQEVDHAVQNGKRLIPIVARDVNPNDVHAALAKVNWVYGREQDDFDGAINKTLSAIRTDLAWVEAQRRLQVRALEWDKRRDNSLLLRGKDLREAEEQFASAGQKDPQPTDLQRHYILESRRGESRTRNILLAISAVVMVVLVIASVIAVRQSNYATSQAATAVAESNMRGTAEANAVSEANTRATAQANEATSRKLAEERATIARAGELAAHSTTMRSKNPPLSYLLGVEALNLLENNRTKSTLLENIQDSPYVMQYLCGHDGHVTSIAISPDEKMIASGSVDKTIILWNMETHQQMGLPLSGHSDSITTLAFSPDGKILASGSADMTVIFWDVEKHKQIGFPLSGYSSAVRSVVFSPDGKILASDDEGSVIFLWDVATRKLIGEPFDGFAYATPPSTSVGGGSGGAWEGSGGHTLAFSPDGKTLASGMVYNALILWDVSTVLNTSVATRQPVGTPLEEIRTTTIGDILQNGVKSVAFSADGMTLASGYQSGEIVLWDLTTQPVVGKHLIGHKSDVYSLKFNARTHLLASMSSDGTVILWDWGAGELSAQLPSGHSDPTNLVFTSTWTLALGSYDNSVALWHVGTNLAEAGFSKDFFGYDYPETIPLSIGQRIENYEAASDVAFSPDGKILAYPANSTIQIWDVAARERMSEPHFDFDYAPSSVAFAPNGKTLALGDSGSQGGTGGIILWDIKNGKPVSGMFGSNISKLAFALDGKTLFSVSRDGMITAWDVETQQAIGKPIEIHIESSETRMAFNKQVTMLASFYNKTTRISLWNLSTGQSVGTLLTNENFIPSVSFSPDGKTLASGGGNGITIWDLATFQPIGRSFGDNTEALDFSPDAKILVSGSYSGITLWDMETRQPINQPLPKHVLVHLAVFSPDNRVLFTSGSEKLSLSPKGTSYLWDMEPRVWAEKTCQHVGRNLTYSEWMQYFPEESYRKSCPDYPIHPSVIANFLELGDQLAVSGKIEEAVVAYQDAVNILPGIKDSVPDLLTRAEHKFSESILQEGDEAARMGNVQLALEKYAAALKLDAGILGGVSPNLRAKLEIVTAIIELDSDGALKFIDAQVDYPDIMESINVPRVLNNICWRGSLIGHALEVKDACERALKLRPDGGYADSRGLNRALMGDFEGAIKDFKAAILWFSDHGHADYAEEREEWIAALEIGQNPFNQQTLEALKNE